MIVVSDGWDRGDPAIVAAETARLRRNCHRLVWLNPLAGTPGYQPLAGGMRAAYPYIDDFLPAGTVASLERLGEILGGVRSADTRRGSEAAAHAALPGVAEAAEAATAAGAAPPGVVGGEPTDPRHGQAHPMKELLDTLQGWQGEGIDVGRAVVVRTFGSAPRPEGAVLLYASDGRIAGSVSGGCVEGAAAEEIEKARADGHARVIRYGISDEQAWDVGLACGGTIDVLVEPAVPSAAVTGGDRVAGGRWAWHGRRHAAPRGLAAGRLRPARAGTGAPPEATLAVHDDGSLEGTLGDATLDAQLVEQATEALRRGMSRTVELGGRSLFVEVYPVRPRLVVVGAVEVARSLVRLAKELGFETVVIDGRASFATPERFPDVDRLVVGWPDEVADEIGLGPNDAVAVLTHDVKFDEPAIIEALRRECRYVGAVGSRKTQAERGRRLLEAGVSEEELARLRGPVGLDLGGRAPAETALAILAEVVAERYGGSGRPMKERAVATAR